MNYNKLDNIQITPNKSVAGVELGATKKTLQKIRGTPLDIEKDSFGDEEWIYKNVKFWFKSDKIDQINIFDLYAGKTKKGICLGSTKYEVEDAYGVLSWDGSWLINTPPFGIGFDFMKDFSGDYVSDIFIFKE